jgi:hypothetical protein
MGAVLRWAKASPAAVLAVFLVEAAAMPRPSVQPRDLPNSYAALIERQADLADFLKREPGWFRVDFDEEVVPYNFGDLYGIEQFVGYVASMPARFNAIIGDQRARQWYGVRYWVGRTPSDPAQVEVFRSRSGVRVYRDPRVGEPVWATHEIPCDAPDRFRVVSRAPEEAVFEADLACPGRVLVGDPYYRGWRLHVDGKRVPIQEAEGGVRAAPVSAGAHRMEFRYRPASVWIGAGLTAVGVAITLILRVFPV